MSKAPRNDLTFEELRSVLSYDAETGQFLWKNCSSDRVKPNDVAGYLDRRGYRFIRVNTKPYLAHRLAWLYMTGCWPKELIDHIDMNRSNNAFSNLREATHLQNNANRGTQCTNRLGIKGVRKIGKRYQAAIRLHGKYNHLGMYDTPEEAHAIYMDTAEKLYGEFARAA